MTEKLRKRNYAIRFTKRICEGLSVSSDSLLFGDQSKNDVDYMSERLKRLSHDKYLIIESMINKILQVFALLDK